MELEEKCGIHGSEVMMQPDANLKGIIAYYGIR